jgi:ATP-dependent DNA helicase RecG
LFSDSPFAKTRARLKALIEAKNGFELAQKDLEIRGPGSFSGVKQWGIPDLAMENLKNIALVEQTKAAAKKILQKDPELKSYPLLREKLEKFKEKIHLE